MSLADFADIFLGTGLFLVALTGVVLIAVCFGGGTWNLKGILTDKALRKIILDDYRYKRVAFGGMLGIVRLLIILALIVLGVGGILQLVSLL